MCGGIHYGEVEGLVSLERWSCSRGACMHSGHHSSGAGKIADFINCYMSIHTMCAIQCEERSSVHVQWNLSKTATFGPVLTNLYKEVAALQRWIAML